MDRLSSKRGPHGVLGSRIESLPLGVCIYQRLQSGIPSAAAAPTLLMLVTVAVGVAGWLLVRRRTT